MTYGNDIKMTTRTNFKTSRNSVIKEGGTVTVRIQDPAQLLTKLLIKLRNQLSSAIIKQDFIVFIV